MAPKSCRPSNGDRSKWTIVQRNPLRMTPWKSTFVEDAVRGLSQSDYSLLESFRSVFPTLHVECCPRPCNAFMLYRSHYVASTDNEGPINQKDLSKDASKLWNTVVDQGPYLVWADDIRELWYRMYPGRHLPGRVREELNKQTQKTKGSKKPRINKVRTKRFQHYPSPSVSEVTDFVDGSNKKHKERESSDDEQTSGDDDEEYFPNQKSSHSAPMSSRRKFLDGRQLPTPASTSRELSPPLEPVLSGPTVPRSPQSAPAFHNINLAELNYDDGSEYSTFLNPHEFGGFSSLIHDSSNHSNQIAVGYSIKEHATNTIMDWDQTGLMSDLDPVGLHPIIINTNIPCSDIDSDPPTEIGSYFHLPNFPSYEN